MTKITLFLQFLALMVLNSSNGWSQNHYEESLDTFRMNYLAEFLIHDYDPIDSSNIANIQFYPADTNYIVKAKISLLPDSETFMMPTYAGTETAYRRYAVATFQLFGDTINLTLYQSIRLLQLPGYKDYLFLPFKDLSNGETTYGGGRYLEFRTGNMIGNQLQIDFNRAYNPYCAYSDGYQCPIPPRENHVDIAIPVGEKVFIKANSYIKN